MNKWITAGVAVGIFATAITVYSVNSGESDPPLERVGTPTSAPTTPVETPTVSITSPDSAALARDMRTRREARHNSPIYDGPAHERPQRQTLSQADKTSVREQQHEDYIDTMIDTVSELATQRQWTVGQTDEVIAEIEERMDAWHSMRSLRRGGVSGRGLMRREMQALLTDSEARIIAIVGETDAEALKDTVWADRDGGPPQGF